MNEPRFNHWATFQGKPLTEMDKDELLRVLAHLHFELQQCYIVMTAEQTKRVAEKLSMVMMLPDIPAYLRRWWPARYQGMIRVSFASWQYRGYAIYRHGRHFRVERVPGVRSIFTDEFPTLRKAKAFVDWLVEAKG